MTAERLPGVKAPLATADKAPLPGVLAEEATDGTALAARVGAKRWVLTLSGATMLNPSTRRLLLSSPELADLEYQPGQDLMLTVGRGERGPLRRRYTIRSFSRPQGQVALDVVLHGSGVGALWAEAASTGDAVEAIGPRGKVTLQRGAPWHLFVGDEAFAPAALTMAEALADGDAKAFLLIVVAGQGHEHPTALTGAQAPRWLYRRAGVSDGELLVGALRDLPLPDGAGAAYLGGERASVSMARAALLERGLAAEQILAKAYWRAGSANAPHGEPERD